MTTKSQSIELRMLETGGRPSGFDYMRLVLAILVVCVHSVGTSYGLKADAELFQSIFRAPIRMILPMFFTLSGFLVAGSLLRTKTIGMFMGLRAIRIYPALTVEVLLSALIIGPFLTQTSLSEYFTSPVFFRYLLNTTGHISFVLPGVFQNNPQPITVNSQLWTVPFELLCYVSLMTLALIGGRKWKIIFPISAIAFTIAHFVLRWQSNTLKLLPSGPVSGSLLVISFIIGVAIYMYQDKIHLNFRLFAFSLISSLLLLDIVPGGDYLATFFIGYITIFIGLSNPKRLKIINGADYSYGIFLYGFVVQQAVMNTLPWAQHWYLNTIISLLLVTVFAAFSWHYIEKPSLKLKKVLVNIENKYIANRSKLK